MSRTTLGVTLIVLGLALAIVSGLAHEIGLSFTADDVASDSFGGKQVIGIVVGLAVAGVGLGLSLRGRRA